MDVDHLYGAPLEEFVTQRRGLARELRKQGKRDEAADVAALRKPSVAAWAVNQLVRTQPRSVAELFEAGDALQEAHRGATTGRGDAAALRSAAQRERSAVDDLMQAARGLLTSDGHELSPTIIDRVAETLRAAALDEQARAQVRDGQLERELRHVGLGVLSGGGATQPAARAEPKSKQSAAKKRAGKACAGEAEAHDREVDEQERRARRAEEDRRKRERDQALKAARDVEAKARRQVERATRALKLAQRLRDRAADDLEAAEQSLAEARADADEAEADLERAQEELERI
jgi:hypothetical protein